MTTDALLGMAGYHRKFCNNFSVIAEPLTNLLYDKKVRYVWTEACQSFFCSVGAILKVFQLYLHHKMKKK